MEKTQVQKEFEAFSAVPRCSFHNEKALAYIKEQVEALGYEYILDEKNGNILIRRPAVIGKRDRAAVVLQGHLDMVAQTAPGVEHDFTKDPIELKIENDFYTAEGTTLGADDGAAVALAMAILKQDGLQNPPVEVLFTTDEEVGMLSVKNGDFSELRGRYLINLDNCDEGRLIVGCCGGTSAVLSMPIETSACKGTVYTLKVDGLKGGHSGIEINKERANAIKIMAHLMLSLSEQYDLRVKRIFNEDGKDNAIANNCTIELIGKAEDEQLLKKTLRDTQKKFRQVFRKTDARIRLAVTAGEEFEGEAFTEDCAFRLLSLIEQLPFGVIKREQNDFTKPETSANIGIIETTDSEVTINCSIRSSVTERGRMVAKRVENLARLTGANAVIAEEYPAWQPDFETSLLAPFKSVYREMTGKFPEIDTIHAGLECGYLMQKSNLQAAVSMGPNITGEHTTEEKLSISSLNRTYAYLKAVIERV